MSGQMNDEQIDVFQPRTFQLMRFPTIFDSKYHQGVIQRENLPPKIVDELKKLLFLAIDVESMDPKCNSEAMSIGYATVDGFGYLRSKGTIYFPFTVLNADPKRLEWWKSDSNKEVFEKHVKKSREMNLDPESGEPWDSPAYEKPTHFSIANQLENFLEVLNTPINSYMTRHIISDSIFNFEVINNMLKQYIEKFDGGLAYKNGEFGISNIVADSYYASLYPGGLSSNQISDESLTQKVLDRYKVSVPDNIPPRDNNPSNDAHRLAYEFTAIYRAREMESYKLEQLGVYE